jgi:hypothetical protein
VVVKNGHKEEMVNAGAVAHMRVSFSPIQGFPNRFSDNVPFVDNLIGAPQLSKRLLYVGWEVVA